MGTWFWLSFPSGLLKSSTVSSSIVGRINKLNCTLGPRLELKEPLQRKDNSKIAFHKRFYFKRGLCFINVLNDKSSISIPTDTCFMFFGIILDIQ